jgi:hypothetical protein
VKLAEAFAILDLDREVKWYTKYARQNGIHVSPTFMIDGLVQADLSSGDPVADWLSRLQSIDAAMRARLYCGPRPVSSPGIDIDRGWAPLTSARSETYRF